MQIENDPKYEHEARKTAARYGQKPLRWRYDPVGGSLIILFEDGRKVNTRNLPPATTKDEPKPAAPRKNAAKPKDEPKE
jgi:hypothetical protein